MRSHFGVRVPVAEPHGPARLRQLHAARERSGYTTRARDRLQLRLRPALIAHTAAAGIEDPLATAPKLHERPFNVALRICGRWHDGVQA